MDEKSNQLLQEILNQQKEQTALLRKHLWRLRFSLFGLMLLMTLTAVGLGIGVYFIRPKTTPGITTMSPYLNLNGYQPMQRQIIQEDKNPDAQPVSIPSK